MRLASQAYGPVNALLKPIGISARTWPAAAAASPARMQDGRITIIALAPFRYNASRQLFTAATPLLTIVGVPIQRLSSEPLLLLANLFQSFSSFSISLGHLAGSTGA